MEYFNVWAKCSICKKDVMRDRYRLPKANGWICKECYKKCKGQIKLKTASVTQIKSVIKRNEDFDKGLKNTDFQVTTSFVGVEFDDKKRKFRLPVNMQTLEEYSLDDVEKCVLLEDNREVTKDELEKIIGNGLLDSLFTSSKRTKYVGKKTLKIKVIFKNDKYVYVNVYDPNIPNNAILYSSMYKTLYRRSKNIIKHFYSFKEVKKEDSWM